jgi:Ca-activated chloride channel family protein
MSRFPKWHLWLSSAVAAWALASLHDGKADQVKLNVSVSHPFLQADQKQTAFLKVGLTGFRGDAIKKRAPINVGLVLDRSGSMSGEKIRKAKEAAMLFVRRLSRDDIVSVVVYDTNVSVLVPATKASDTETILAGIQKLSTGDTTALFAGVSKGAEEVRKFLDRNQVNRLVLLSDGLANVGPSSPADLATLGASLIKEGISVTTLGLGSDYNEDLMTQLAVRSDGNHAFVETPDDLAKFFDLELGAVASVVAQEVVVEIVCAEGVRPIRLLGPQADISGQKVIASVNQIYSEQERYILLEVEVPPMAEGKTLSLATVTVSYANMSTQTTDVLTSTVAIRFTKSKEQVDKEVKPEVMTAAVTQIAVVNNELAVTLRDQGKIDEARKLLLDNAIYLGDNAAKFQSKDLERLREINRQDADNLAPEKWQQQRKKMRDVQAKEASLADF